MDEVYTAEMGNPPSDDDMMSIEMLQGKRKPMPKAMPMPKRPMPQDLGMLEPDMGSLERHRPKPMRAKKSAKPSMPMKKGGSVCSASKRADGIATKGKTKGRFV